MNTTENIPQVWDDERDGTFFRITAAVLPARFCYGASVLLAGYDADEPALESPLATAVPGFTPAASSNAAAHVSADH